MRLRDAATTKGKTTDEDKLRTMLKASAQLARLNSGGSIRPFASRTDRGTHLYPVLITAITGFIVLIVASVAYLMH